MGRLRKALFVRTGQWRSCHDVEHLTHFGAKCKKVAVDLPFIGGKSCFLKVNRLDAFLAGGKASQFIFKPEKG